MQHCLRFTRIVLRTIALFAGAKTEESIILVSARNGHHTPGVKEPQVPSS
jgi:hypothetical protein